MVARLCPRDMVYSMALSKSLLYASSPFFSSAATLGVTVPRDEEMQALSYENGGLHCQYAQEMSVQDHPLHADYLVFWTQAKTMKQAFRKLTDTHAGFDLLNELVGCEEIAAHSEKWLALGRMMLRLASQTREEMSPNSASYFFH